MNTNLLQLIGLMRKSGNPQQFLFNFMEQQMGNNPFMSNLLALAKRGDSGGLETIARNLCREKGMDYNKEFTSFKKTLGL